MSDDDEVVARERQWWDEKAVISLQVARGVIASDPACWEPEEAIKRILPAVGPACVAGGRVLDIGCGVGRMTIPMAAALPQCQLVGIDISPAMIAHAQRLAPAVQWLVSDGRTIPDAVGQLVAAYSVIVFQHIPVAAQAAYIRQVAERLVPGGRFRFQIHEGTWQGFLSNQVTEVWVRDTCATVGLHVAEVERVLPAPELNTQPWLWVTAEKP